MFANFLNLAFSSCPSDNTALGLVERTGFDYEHLLTDSLRLLPGFFNDFDNVIYTT